MNLFKIIGKVLSIAAATLAILIGLMGTGWSYVDEGEIKEFFFLNEDSAPQLTVWFSFERGGGRSVAHYKEHLKAYDLQTGRVLGSIIMSRKLHYRLYASDHNKAWGYCKQAGIQLLDLVRPGFIASELEILKRNPRLGEKVKLYLRNAYDPITNSLHIVAVDEQVYRLNPNLEASTIEHVPDRVAPKKREWAFAKDWGFYYLEHHLGKHLHRKKAECSAKSVTLFEPKLIKELNKNIQQKDRVWVIHKSAILGKYDRLISLVVPNGEELARLNFGKIFKKDKKPKVLGSYTRDKEVLIFVASGIPFNKNIEGFSFIALRTDAKSGEFLGLINYL